MSQDKKPFPNYMKDTFSSENKKEKPRSVRNEKEMNKINFGESSPEKDVKNDTLNYQDKLELFRKKLPNLSQLSFDRLVDSLKIDKFDSQAWLKWLWSIQNNQFFIDLDGLFLKHNNWVNLDLKSLINIEKVVINYSVLQQWCKAIFHQIHDMKNSEQIINEALLLFLSIIECIRRIEVANHDIPKLSKNYNVLSEGMSPLKNLQFALEKASSPKTQLKILSFSLPDEKTIKLLFEQGFPFVCHELTFPTVCEEIINVECSTKKLYGFTEELCGSILRYIALYQEKSFFTAYQQAKNMMNFSSNTLYGNELILVLKSYWANFFRQTEIFEVTDLLESAEKIKIHLGDNVFYSIFNREPNYCAQSMSELKQICELSINSYDDNLLIELKKPRHLKETIEHLRPKSQNLLALISSEKYTKIQDPILEINKNDFLKPQPIKQPQKVKIPPKQPTKMELGPEKINKFSAQPKNKQAFFLEQIGKNKGGEVGVPVKKMPPNSNEKMEFN